MSKLYRHVASGVIVNGAAAGNPAVEIWSCSLHSLQPDGVDAVAMNVVFATAWQTYFTNAGTGIASNCRTRLVKSNEIDPQTGLQVTSPTVELPVDYAGGHGIGSCVTFLSARVSLDNGTRDRHARGGWFLPMIALNCAQNGRFISEDVAQIALRSKNLLVALETFGNLGVSEAGVYSRTAQAFFPSTRVRVGDVPDLIRSRKNALVETYTVEPLPA